MKKIFICLTLLICLVSCSEGDLKESDLPTKENQQSNVKETEVVEKEIDVPQEESIVDFFSEEVSKINSASYFNFNISINTRYDIEPGVPYQDPNELVEYDTYNQDTLDAAFVNDVILSLRDGVLQERIEAIFGLVGPQRGFSIQGTYDEKRILIYSQDYHKVFYLVDEGVVDVYYFEHGYEDVFKQILGKYI